MKLANRQIFTAYIIFIVVAEVVTSFVNLGYGFLFHSLILISLLILLLALKGMVTADTRKSLKTIDTIDKALTIVILPLLISFTLNISKILGFL